MKKILVFGYFGFNNFGDEFLLKGILKLLREFSNNSVIYILYNIKNVNGVLYSYRNIFNNIFFVSRWNFFRIILSIFNVDTVLCAGGILQDRTSILSLFYYLAIIVLAKLFNKRVLILGTEFELKSFNINFLVKILEKVDYVGVRNSRDLNNIKLLSSKIKVEFFPDISFIFYDKNLTNSMARIKNDIFGIILKSPSSGWSNESFNKIINFCKEVAKKNFVYLIPLHLGEDRFSEDYSFALKVLDKVERCCIKVWDEVEEIKNIFEDVRFFVVSRFHGIVMCLFLEKEFVCVSESMKLVNFVKDFRLENILLSDYEKINFSTIKRINLNFKELKKVCMEYNMNLSEKFKSFKQFGWI